MKLLLGLGNVGSRYDRTPHNLGFHTIQAVAKRYDAAPFRSVPRFHSHLTRTRVHQEVVIFALPQTMMNASGVAARLLQRYYRVQPRNLWVVHDDLDLPPGTFRHSFDSRAAGHRGVQSVIDELGTKKFHRLRIGIGRHPRFDAETYVVQPMTSTLHRATLLSITEIVDCFPTLCLGIIEEHESPSAHSRHHQSACRSVGK